MRSLFTAVLAAASLTACGPAAPAGDPASVLENPSWFEPAEPMRLVGPVHSVGTRGLGMYLIATPAGHILLDGGMPACAPLIEASILRLGFQLRDVRVLLITQAHIDHVGTLAHFQRITGARVEVMEAEVDLLKSGGASDYLYGRDERFRFEPVVADRALHDGDTVTLGGITLTARHTPGHTRGCTTWVTDVEEGGRSWRVVFPGSTSINPGTRLVKDPSYPGILDDFRRALAVLDSLQPDIWLPAHPSYEDFEARRSRASSEGARAFVDPEGYRRRIASQKESLDEIVARETGGAP